MPNFTLNVLTVSIGGAQTRRHLVNALFVTTAKFALRKDTMAGTHQNPYRYPYHLYGII